MFPDSIGSRNLAPPEFVASSSSSRLGGGRSGRSSSIGENRIDDDGTSSKNVGLLELQKQAIRAPRLFLTKQQKTKRKDHADSDALIMKSTKKDERCSGVYFDNVLIEREDDSEDDDEDLLVSLLEDDDDDTSSSMNGSSKRKDALPVTDLDFLIASVETAEPTMDTKKKRMHVEDSSAQQDTASTATTSSTGNQEEADVLCQAVNDWKPFTNHVATIMQREKLPFEYFDIWVPEETLTSQEQKQDDDDKTDSSAVLRHVGHGTNGNTDMMSIMTLYNMNQFGRSSEQYAFLPGIGLPGRVFETTEPMWDDSLQRASYQDFPRTDLAKKHGVKKGLGIPLHKNGQQAILALYTTNDIPKDINLVQLAYYEFQKYKIQLPLKQASIVVQPYKALPALCNGEDSKKEEADKKDYYTAILPDDLDVEMARFLGDHLPENNLTGQSLQFVLFKAPCRRALYENVNVQRLKQQFTLLKQQRMLRSPEIAAVIVQEWDRFCPNHLQLSQQQQQQELWL
ncbi:anthocyanin regulatory Lc protein [Seminavis robusta]|uniref:Anthocyanin regulatory Lc protein n=1 Tax=Seminavis robusta TaxID=568900 RepID=A0A9N8E236_9STRA|nr:anthocyanin regulatory Lc protein [Seminavis robusta]|eukprot:Sro574_g169270.1 anthocyanin regulatory Lc protein (512) ;mRNA; r:55646-57181